MKTVGIGCNIILWQSWGELKFACTLPCDFKVSLVFQ
jgi:hypothetical protein